MSPIEMLAIIIVVLCMVTCAPGQEQACWGAQTPYADILESAKSYCDCNFPPQQFNVSCLLSSCPLLSGICPLTSNRTINQTALTSAVSALNACIKQNSLICNFNMSHIQMAPLSWTTAQLIPLTVANGTVVRNPGTGFIENFSNAAFTLVQNGNANGPIVTLSVQLPNYHGQSEYNCIFDILPTSIVHSLSVLVPQLNFLNAPHVKSNLGVNVTATVSIDLSCATPTINTINQRFDLNIIYSNFVNSNNVSLDQNLINLFNTGMNSILKTSVIPSRIVNFLANYAALGLQAAQINCPSIN